MNLILLGILLIVLSLVAVPRLILSKRPETKELLDKIAPFQGWAGVLFCLWGLWNVIDCFLSLNLFSWGMWGTIMWVTCFAYAAITAILGFMLGYNLIVEYVLAKNEKTAEKGAQIQAKLAGVQGTLGIIGIIVGVWCIILYFILRGMLFF